MAAPNITVSSTAVRVELSDIPPLTTNPAGTFVMPAMTVDQYGRVTKAVQSNDIASNQTQIAMSAEIDAIIGILTDGFVPVTWS